MLRSTFQTAAAGGHKAEPDRRLRELHQGELEGMAYPEAVAAYPAFFQAFNEDPAGTPVPGGEAMGVLVDRGLAFAEEMTHKHRGELVVAVSHQMLIAALCATVDGESLANWRKYCVRNTECNVLRYCGGQWTLTALGWVPPAT